jgi:predicted nuclease of predicted toxin-antitoxin system
MRLLLDESVPRRLARHLAGVEVDTVHDRTWSGLKNGELLRAAESEYDVFVTADQNLQYQQHLPGFAIGVVVLAARTNRLEDLLPLVSQLLAACPGLSKGEVVIISEDRRSPAS